MAQAPLNPQGGDAPSIHLRLSDDIKTRLVLRAAAVGVTVSEQVRRDVAEANARAELELAEAAGLLMLPVLDGGHAPPGGSTATA